MNVLQWSSFAVSSALALTPSPTLADIFDEAEITITEYTVTGSNLGEVQVDMGRNGPQGYWAYTSWYASWDGNCQTHVSAEIIMPVLAEDADLHEKEIAEFERMSEALMLHELGHVQIGLDYAADMVAQGCPADTSAIDAYWKQAELDYDAETQHGQRDGVYLDAP